jgi:hypothetical protein
MESFVLNNTTLQGSPMKMKDAPKNLQNTQKIGNCRIPRGPFS